MNSIKALLQGFEPVVIDTEDIVAKLDELELCDGYVQKQAEQHRGILCQGKDTAKLRIVVKRNENEGITPRKGKPAPVSWRFDWYKVIFLFEVLQ